MHEVDAEGWGIATGYRDYRGNWRDVPPETVRRVAELLGAEAGAPLPRSGPPPVRVVTAGASGVELPRACAVATEDGMSVAVDGPSPVLPPDLPLGYHRIVDEHGEVPLIVVPAACHLPDDLWAWGWALQLYGLRSADSWGMGDLGDLRRFGRWARSGGAGVVLVNPLHASLPTRQEPSPYSPSSRCFRNPVYLRVAGVGGGGGGVHGGGDGGIDGRSFNADAFVDRDAVWAAKSAALEAQFAGFGGASSFDRFCAVGGEALRKYAAFCALAERHGTPWWEWGDDERHPDGAGVARVFEAEADRVRFHQWLQWQVDEQLAAAGAEIPLMHDVAIGCDAAGADAWLWQDAFCLGARVGAPPDEFNTQGQNWGLPPFDPWRLRAAAYEPFVQTVRSIFRHAGAIRVDHVMGLFRLYWVPEGASARDGTYVHYPWEDLLGIVALESVRAGAYVVGEDLGTIEPWMRDELARRRVLSYRLLWFEPDRPAAYPRHAMAAVTTHDLPTIAGLWSGSDLAEQEALDLEPNVEGTAALRDRLASWTGADDGTPVEELVRRTHGLLAEAPSLVVTATLDDALCVEPRPNVPGTTTERPNWSLPLPSSLEEIESDPKVAAVADALRTGRSRGEEGAS